MEKTVREQFDELEQLNKEQRELSKKFNNTGNKYGDLKKELTEKAKEFFEYNVSFKIDWEADQKSVKAEHYEVEFDNKKIGLTRYFGNEEEDCFDCEYVEEGKIDEIEWE